jgi:hypothetical protein
MVRSFQIISDKFNVIFTSNDENYEQKFITKLYNCCYTIFATHTDTF